MEDVRGQELAGGEKEGEGAINREQNWGNEIGKGRSSIAIRVPTKIKSTGGFRERRLKKK